MIEQKNQDPKRKIQTKVESLFHKIVQNHTTEKILQEKGYNYQAILPKNEFLYLQNDPFLKLGGDLEEVTDIAHPDNLQLFRDIAGYFDLELVGIDFIAKDISQSWKKQACAILELNSLPCIDLHHFPNLGKKQDVVGVLLDRFLELYQ